MFYVQLNFVHIVLAKSSLLTANLSGTKSSLMFSSEMFFKTQLCVLSLPLITALEKKLVPLATHFKPILVHILQFFHPTFHKSFPTNIIFCCLANRLIEGIKGREITHTCKNKKKYRNFFFLYFSPMPYRKSQLTIKRINRKKVSVWIKYSHTHIHLHLRHEN